MSSAVFMTVLAAAAMHAGWNAFLKARLEPFLAMTLITASAGVVGMPLVLAFGWPRAAAWPWVVASVALHFCYYLALTAAYRRGEMGQIYPIVRGGAPLCTALVSIAVLRDPLRAQALVGIVILGAGVVMMSAHRRRGGARLEWKAIAFAVLTACIISGYTVVDGTGARRAGDPSAYIAALCVLDGLPLPLFALARRGSAIFAPMRRFIGQGLAGGAMSVGAYWIAVWAMTLAPIAIVAALRETSVLFSAAIATFFLKEPFVPARGMAALIILAGILLIRWQ